MHQIVGIASWFMLLASFVLLSALITAPATLAPFDPSPLHVAAD